MSFLLGVRATMQWLLEAERRRRRERLKATYTLVLRLLGREGKVLTTHLLTFCCLYNEQATHIFGP